MQTFLDTVVSTHSIRYRILKVRHRRVVAEARQGFNPFDPIQDTESWQCGTDGSFVGRFNPFDPIQDTERCGIATQHINHMAVSTHSIRYRILKGPRVLGRSRREIVSTHSIRYRILKVGMSPSNMRSSRVSTHSIRYRILKGAETAVHLDDEIGFNPFDPIQDTESRPTAPACQAGLVFQPIRSDTGY